MNVAFEGSDWRSVMGICGDLTQFLLVRGYWGDAIRTGEQALESARSAKDQREISWFAHNLGTTLRSRGEMEKARRLFQESLEIEKKRSSQGEITAAFQRTETELRRWKFGWLVPRVQRFYQLCLEVQKPLHSKSLEHIATNLYQQGTLALDQGDRQEARRLYHESLEASKKLDYQYGIGAAINGLGRVALIGDDLEEAGRLYEESLEIGRKLTDQELIDKSLSSLATIALMQGDRQKARMFYQQSLEGSKKSAIGTTSQQS